MKIIYKDRQIEIPEGSRVIDVFGKEIEEAKVEIVTCKINHEVKSLDTVLQEENVVELLNLSDRDGSRAYIRGLLFIMSMAFH